MNKDALKFKTYGSNEINYMDHVRSELSDIELGELKLVDLSGETVERFRRSLSHIKTPDKHFKTKVSGDGCLLVKRIK